MKSAIFTAFMVVALAGAALALPAGPGGTFYFGGPPTNSSTTHGTYLFYLDIDSDWNTLGNVVSMGTINAVISEEYYGVPPGYGSPELWVNPTTGKMDMAGEYHNATLLMGAYYNSTPAAGSGSGTTQGADLISVDSKTMTVNILNDGFNSGTTPNTTHLYSVVAVDGGYTPNGENLGIAVDGPGAVWVDTDGNGVFEDGAVTSPTQGREQEYLSITSGYQVNGQAVTGVVIGHSYASTSASYRTASGYVKVNSYDSDLADANCTIGSYDGMAVADTDNNGVPDVYWSSGDRDLVHATDLNNDGDWTDPGEAWVMSTGEPPGSSQGPFDMEVIRCPGGEYVLIWYGHYNKWSSNDTLGIYAFELDSGGDIMGSGQLLTYYNIDQVDGDAGMASFETYNQELEFAPLGSAEADVPEPGTMLLVGSGVLGLAGALRRRFLA